MDDKTFATLLVSAFMVITALLQLPEFLGPSFNPFVTPFKALMSALVPQEKVSSKSKGVIEQDLADDGDDDIVDDDDTKGTPSKKKRQKKKKKA
jgi:hypothetical protein